MNRATNGRWPPMGPSAFAALLLARVDAVQSRIAETLGQAECGEISEDTQWARLTEFNDQLDWLDSTLRKLSRGR